MSGWLGRLLAGTPASETRAGDREMPSGFGSAVVDRALPASPTREVPSGMGGTVRAPAMAPSPAPVVAGPADPGRASQTAADMGLAARWAPGDRHSFGRWLDAAGNASPTPALTPAEQAGVARRNAEDVAQQRRQIVSAPELASFLQASPAPRPRTFADIMDQTYLEGSHRNMQAAAARGYPAGSGGTPAAPPGSAAAQARALQDFLTGITQYRGRHAMPDFSAALADR